MSDDMAAEQREPEDGPRWMAELRRLDGDGKIHTVVRIVTEDAPSATAALHAAAELCGRYAPPPVRFTTMDPDDERRLIAALDEANAPHVVSPGPGAPWEEAKAGSRLFWALYHHKRAAELLKEASPGFLKAYQQAQDAFTPRQAPGPADGDDAPPVVSPGGSGPGGTVPETGPGSPESAEDGSPRGTDTPGASGGVQGAVMLRADGEPMQRRPRSRAVYGQTVTNSYLHAINEGNRMTLGGVDITPREIQVVFVDGRFEKMILVGWRGAGVVWTPDCGWELPEDLRELTDPAQCDVETVMERRERRVQEADSYRPWIAKLPLNPHNTGKVYPEDDEVITGNNTVIRVGRRPRYGQEASPAESRAPVGLRLAWIRCAPSVVGKGGPSGVRLTDDEARQLAAALLAQAGPPPVVSGAEIFHAALDAAADRVVDLSDLARKAADRKGSIDDTL